MIRGIAFDIDGTLLNHEQALDRALHHLYPPIKKKIPHSSFNEFLEVWKINTDHFIKKYLDGLISFKQQRILRVKSVFNNWDCHLSTEEAWSIFQKYLVEYERNWELFDDVFPCLKMLKDFPLGVISDGPSKQQRRKLSYTGINSYFSSVIISGEVGVQKPQPAIYKMSAKELNLSLDEIVYVGDQLEKDACGALNAGMYGVWINRTNQVPENSNVITIQNLTELLKVVKQL